MASSRKCGYGFSSVKVFYLEVYVDGRSYTIENLKNNEAFKILSGYFKKILFAEIPKNPLDYNHQKDIGIFIDAYLWDDYMYIDLNSLDLNDLKNKLD